MLKIAAGRRRCVEQLAGIVVRDDAVGAAATLLGHPTIHGRDISPRDLSNTAGAAHAGDDSLSGIKMNSGHASICDIRDYCASPFRDLRDRKFCVNREYAGMNDPQLDIRLWMATEIEALGHGAKGALAKHLGVRPDAITRIMNTTPGKETREIKAHELESMRTFFTQMREAANGDSTLGADHASLPRRVRLVGKAGAGPQGEVVFDADEQTLGHVDPQANSTDKTVALLVEGDSMRGIANDGWIVYYDDVHEAPGSELYGELCVVGLESGQVLVKYLQPGRGDGLFDLESTNAPTMRDVIVRWVAPITNIVPRRAARRLMRIDPTVGVETAKAS